MIEGVRGPDTREEQSYVNQVFAAAEKVVPRMELIEPNASANRTGGIMVIAKPGKDGYIVIREIGQIKPDSKRSAKEKREKYTIFALAKVALLLMHPEWFASSQNLKLSDEESLTYYDGTVIPAGAIRIDDDHIIGFSSFLQEDDESTVLASEVEAGITSAVTASWQALGIQNSRFSEIKHNLLPN